MHEPCSVKGKSTRLSLNSAKGGERGRGEGGGVRGGEQGDVQARLFAGMNESWSGKGKSTQSVS